MKKVISLLLVVFFVLCFQGCEVSGSEESFGFDWEQIKASPKSDSIGQIIILCRTMDRWHRGTISRLVISYKDSRVVDGLGNEQYMSPEDWKGMVTLIHRHVMRSETPNYMKIRSGPAVLFREGTDWADGHGEIPQFWYHIQLIDHEQLEFLMMGPVE